MLFRSLSCSVNGHIGEWLVKKGFLICFASKWCARIRVGLQWSKAIFLWSLPRFNVNYLRTHLKMNNYLLSMYSYAQIFITVGHPPGQTPPNGLRPPTRQTPPAQCMLGYPLPPAVTAADSTHPTGMHSCLDGYLLDLSPTHVTLINQQFRSSAPELGGLSVEDQPPASQ